MLLKEAPDNRAQGKVIAFYEPCKDGNIVTTVNFDNGIQLLSKNGI